MSPSTAAVHVHVGWSRSNTASHKQVGVASYEYTEEASRTRTHEHDVVPAQHATCRTTASFEEGNVAKRNKLEPVFEEVSESSQLFPEG